jgi:hypothetical protein
MLVICAYFNPFRSQARERAYEQFRTGLAGTGAEVLCVEQVFPGVPRVGNPGDITIAGGDLLWQKECLLQIGIDQAIAQGHERILLCDADVLFETGDAFDKIDRCFSRLDYFQPFETVTLEYTDGPIVTRSLMSVDHPRPYGSGHPGCCWAATAALLRQVRLYPYALMGGGDVTAAHISTAAIHHGPRSARFADLCAYFSNYVLYPALLDSLVEWAQQFDGTCARLGYSTGITLRALEHGSRRLRKYAERYQSWRGSGARTAPQPHLDFSVGDKRLLEWTNAENQWRSAIFGYFQSRETEAPLSACHGTGRLMKDHL